MAAQFFDTDESSDTGARGAGFFLLGLGLGALIGASMALLYAPESGEVTRRRLQRRFRALRDEAADEWRDATRTARRELRRRLDQFS